MVIAQGNVIARNMFAVTDLESDVGQDFVTAAA
jgi:hypothetical protein